jgi:hypothetical protein
VLRGPSRRRWWRNSASAWHRHRRLFVHDLLNRHSFRDGRQISSSRCRCKCRSLERLRDGVLRYFACFFVDLDGVIRQVERRFVHDGRATRPVYRRRTRLSLHRKRQVITGQNRRHRFECRFVVFLLGPLHAPSNVPRKRRDRNRSFPCRRSFVLPECAARMGHLAHDRCQRFRGRRDESRLYKSIIIPVGRY